MTVIKIDTEKALFYFLWPLDIRRILIILVYKVICIFVLSEARIHHLHTVLYHYNSYKNNIVFVVNYLNRNIN